MRYHVTLQKCPQIARSANFMGYFVAPSLPGFELGTARGRKLSGCPPRLRPSWRPVGDFVELDTPDEIGGQVPAVPIVGEGKPLIERGELQANWL